MAGHRQGRQQEGERWILGKEPGLSGGGKLTRVRGEGGRDGRERRASSSRYRSWRWLTRSGAMQGLTWKLPG